MRLVTGAAVLAVGYLAQSISGIAVGTLAIAAGVVAEAGYASLRTRKVLRDPVRPARPADEPLTWGRFFHFYIPSP